jgi:integrase
VQRRKHTYRHYKPKDLAMVVINGHAHYLGKYDSPASWEKYYQLLAQLASGKLPGDCEPEPLDDPPINEVIVRYMTEHVLTYYVKAGQPTSEQETISQALGFVRRVFGTTSATDFTPKKLKAVRDAMIAHKVTRNVQVRDPKTGKVVRDPETGEARTEVRVYADGLGRKYINKQVSRIRAMFAWAIEEEVIDPERGAKQLVALRAVKALKRGKTTARERPRVRPVSTADIKVVLPLIPPTVRAMILVQRYCGGRPQDLVQMRPCDIHRSGSVWEYRPPRFKSEHHNDDNDPDFDRIVYLGPRAQRILKPRLDALEDTPEAYVFSPRRSEADRNAKRRAARRSPMTPSQAARTPKGRKRAPIRDCYSVASYRRAIRRACETAGISIWHPHQLRHSAGTAIRKKFGLEESQAVLGHRELGTTQIYAERSRAKARSVAAAMG